jgi:hypothetical protein
VKLAVHFAAAGPAGLVFGSAEVSLRRKMKGFFTRP